MPRPPVERSRTPPIDANAIDRAARAYLARYVSSGENLRTLLLRRVNRSLSVHGGERAPLVAAVDATLARLVEAGALNDAAYAEARVRRLVRRGVSVGAVRQHLAARGVGSALVADGLEALRAECADPARSAACAYVRRRRLGPFRTDPEERARLRDKDLAALGRAGFSYAIAREVLGSTVEEVEARILG